MSIEEIEMELPNGLHDAELISHSIDYESKNAEFLIDVWIGDLYSTDEDERERYRRGALTFFNLEYFVIEPPLGENQLIFESFAFSVGNPEVEKIKASVKLPPKPEGSFCTYFFIYKIEAFMHVCAHRVEFKFVS